MSLPSYTITCSGCDFEDSYGYYTHYKYEGNPEQQPILRNSWCADCDKIIEACTPFTPEEADEVLNSLYLIRAHLGCLQS